MNKPVILVVDDDRLMRHMLAGLLQSQYRVVVAANGEEALTRVKGKARPDLILLDVLMPGMDGYEICRRIKADPATRDIPLMFLTSLSHVEDEKKGLEMGAADYITKPLSPHILMVRIKTQLENRAAADFLLDQNTFLDAEVRRRTQEVLAVQDATILALASLAETRDTDTGSHVRRTQFYVKALAEQLKGHPRFRDHLNESTIELVSKSASLHDIGKVGIPDHILLRPGRLEREEFEIMKTHTLLGYDAIERTERGLGVELEFLKHTKDIACYHHERWDGAGYPRGMKGEEIPFSARLMAVADVYDALISSRPYKQAMPHEQAAEIILSGKCSQFDPDIVDAFVAVQGAFQEIARRFADGVGNS